MATLLAEAESEMTKNETASSEQGSKNTDEKEAPPSSAEVGGAGDLSVVIPAAEDDEGPGKDGVEPGSYDETDRAMPHNWVASVGKEEKPAKRHHHKSKWPKKAALIKHQFTAVLFILPLLLPIIVVIPMVI